MKLKRTLLGMMAAMAASAALAYALGPQQIPRDRRLADQTSADLGQFEQKVAALEREAAQKPADARAQHVVGTFYFEKTRDASLTADLKREYLARGLKAEDRALEADPDYIEALVYKNIMLRTQAAAETDPATREALIRDADSLRNRALQLQSARFFQPIPEGTVVTPGPPPPPPPPPPGGTTDKIDWVYATTAYSAANGVRPTQTKDTRPIYAPMVMASGIKGEVVLEATVDSRGKVAQVRVVKTQPMLTQAAVDAVRQWEFDPATVDRGTVLTVSATFMPR